MMRQRSATKLSPRECQVVRCIADGLSNKEIGALLHLTRGTVKQYVSMVLAKLHMTSRLQVAVWFLRAMSGARVMDGRYVIIHDPIGLPSRTKIST